MHACVVVPPTLQVASWKWFLGGKLFCDIFVNLMSELGMVVYILENHVRICHDGPPGFIFIFIFTFTFTS